MTAADRAYARGRSLFDWGVLSPDVGRHPSSHLQQGRVANVSQGTDAQAGEYMTYAPAGEKCRACGGPFAKLETVRRVQPTGMPSGRPYVHFECPTSEGAS